MAKQLPAVRDTIAVVTGASGILGCNLAVALWKQSYRVRCTKRSKTNTAWLNKATSNGVEWVDADLRDAKSVKSACVGAHVVFHCGAAVTQQRYPTEEMIQTNVEGTKHIIEAIKNTGVATRLVYVSSTVTVAIAKSFDKPATEKDTWNLQEHGLDDGYAVTKRQGEQLVLEASQKGEIDAVVVNPSYMLGPYCPEDSSASTIAKVIKGEIPGMTAGCNNFVDVRDVANGMIAAWQKGTCGERYILSGYNMMWRDYFTLAAKMGGVRPPSWNIPKFLAMGLGWTGEAKHYLFGTEENINVSRVRWAYCPTFTVSSEKAQQQIGYTVGPIEPAITDSINWFKEIGVLPNNK